MSSYFALDANLNFVFVFVFKVSDYLYLKKIK